MKDKIADVEKVNIVYTQERDSMSPSDYLNTIEISTEDAGAGKYIVIKTDRWAFDNINELVTLLNDFKTRIDKEVVK